MFCEALAYELTDTIYPLSARVINPFFTFYACDVVYEFYNGWIGGANAVVEYITTNDKEVHRNMQKLIQELGDNPPVNCMLIETITGGELKDIFEQANPSDSMKYNYALQFVLQKVITCHVRCQKKSQMMLKKGGLILVPKTLIWSCS